ncbi:MAG: rRNA maturation RNase YbeY [Cyanobacteria bacterium REEB459]|nr:rRNA maturation RNase YbeY [Cyanobacteria bacterium REEB459]
MAVTPPTLEISLDLEHPRADLVAPANWQLWFQTWAIQMALSGSPIDAYELSLRITSDRAIADLNQSFRQVKGPTDVLAFAALENPSPLAAELLQSEPLYLGDIVISLDTAERQAQDQGHSPVWEMAWLAAHGFLHLIGWDHPDPASLVAMLAKQQELLATIELYP